MLGRFSRCDSLSPNATILIVEDEPLIRLALIDMFEATGFVVLDAGDAFEAMALLDTHADSIGIMLTDIRLGDGPDGWDVARYARSRLEDLPIVFVSGDSAGDWREAGINRSVMLAKPVADGDLLAAVRTGLEQSSRQGD
ncbi:response regulator [Qipengyuania mesophila]|uniref:response regulator n=1 Tax=Qipengyuania mesophila TaxID=2867246 RepID=UPI0031E579D9